MAARDRSAVFRLLATFPPGGQAERKVDHASAGSINRRLGAFPCFLLFRLRFVLLLGLGAEAMRAGPAGQVVRVAALGQNKRIGHCRAEVRPDRLLLDAWTKEIGPQELGERRRVLGETAAIAQFARKRTVGVVLHRLDGSRKVGIGPPPPLGIIRMRPFVEVHHVPEMIYRQATQNRYDRDKNAVQSLSMEGESQMM